MATQDVTTFVQALKEFHAQLPPTQQAMLDHLIASAQQHDTAGYWVRYKRNEIEQPPTQEDATAGYSIRKPRSETPEQDDDTAGYFYRKGRTESEQDDDTAGYGRMFRTDDDLRTQDNAQMVESDNDDMWTRLMTWLSQDDTEGLMWRRSRTETPEQDDTEGFGRMF